MKEEQRRRQAATKVGPSPRLTAAAPAPIPALPPLLSSAVLTDTIAATDAPLQVCVALRTVELVLGTVSKSSARVAFFFIRCAALLLVALSVDQLT